MCIYIFVELEKAFLLPAYKIKIEIEDRNERFRNIGNNSMVIDPEKYSVREVSSSY